MLMTTACSAVAGRNARHGYEAMSTSQVGEDDSLDLEIEKQSSIFINFICILFSEPKLSPENGSSSMLPLPVSKVVGNKM